MRPLPLIAIVGPTACGKTSRAVDLALELNAEIVSADSRQVYRGMDIGSGKDMEEYAPLINHFDTAGMEHPEESIHLIDICEAGYRYNLHQYLRDYYIAERAIRSRGHNVILCGGTGMYAEAVLSGLRLPEVPEDKEFRASLASVSLKELHRRLAAVKTLHNTTDVDTHARAVRALEIERYYAANPEAARMADRSAVTRPDSVIIMVDIPREARRRRITERLHKRMEQGMAEEIKSLLDKGIHAEDLLYYGLEYKYVTLYVTGHLSREEMLRQLEIAIHQFAKRQMTWWRGMERRGFTLHPIPYDLPPSDFLTRTKEIIARHISSSH